MSNQVDRFGQPIPATPGYYVIVNSDQTQPPMQGVLRLSGITATQGADGASTLLSVSGVPSGNAVALAESLGSEIPTAGANLTDANAAITITGGAQYVLPAGTLTANRVLTLNVTGAPITGEEIVVLRRDSGAFTYTINNDAATALIVLPASTRFAAYFRFDGTHFALAGAVRIQ